MTDEQPEPPDKTTTRSPAVVLLSGGLDSTTCLAIAMQRGFECTALSFRYGQRHRIELDAARAIAARSGVEQVVVDVDLRVFGGSALTADIAVPKHDSAADLVADLAAEGTAIPATYVPARNTIFLSFALALAEVRGAGDIFIGVNALDYSGYPDCRPEYIEAFEAMSNLATASATAGGVPLRIHAPLIAMTKADIIRCGTALGVDYAMTTSCYDPAVDGGACGRCDSCLLRAKGFIEAGVSDPTRYDTGRDDPTAGTEVPGSSNVSWAE